MPGSVRPDVVSAKDRSKPLTRDNIGHIYEIKFPRDREKEEQNEKCRALLPKGSNNYDVLSVETCGCEGKFNPRRVPQHEKAPEPHKTPNLWDKAKEYFVKVPIPWGPPILGPRAYRPPAAVPGVFLMYVHDENAPTLGGGGKQA